MRSLFNIIEIYLENPQDKDIERALNREFDKRNVVKMYEKMKDLERQLEEYREAIKKHRDSKLSWGLDKSSDDNELWEQLKEQGDER